MSLKLIPNFECHPFAAETLPFESSSCCLSGAEPKPGVGKRSL